MSRRTTKQRRAAFRRRVPHVYCRGCKRVHAIGPHGSPEECDLWYDGCNCYCIVSSWRQAMWARRRAERRLIGRVAS